MSDLNNNILDIQQQFKVNLLNKMKLQNQRYLKSLKIIESLIKENEDLKLTKRLEVSKKTKKKQRSPSKSVFIKNNDISQNIEILNMFKKIDTALNNIIEVINIINKKKYLGKIQTFIEKKDEELNTILMKTIQVINEYIESNMNVNNGILIDVNHKEIFKYLDNILKKVRVESNFTSLEKLVSKTTKTKRTKDNTFKLKDIEKLENRLNEIKESMNRNNVDINTFMFQYKYKDKNISINLNQIKEKVKDCIQFIDKENKFLS